MPYMTIKRLRIGDLSDLDNKYQVYYDVNGLSYSTTVDENTARMLERAKEAGRHEKATEIKKALGIS